MFNTAKLVAGELVPAEFPVIPWDDAEYFVDEDGVKHERYISAEQRYRDAEEYDAYMSRVNPWYESF